jgi:hypothetical protein
MGRSSVNRFYTLGATALSLSLLGIARPALAQKTGLAVKLGSLQPSSGSTRDLTGSRHFGGEVDFATPTGETISVGLYQGSRSGHRLETFTVQAVRSAGVPLLGGRLYTGSGIGLYQIRADGSKRTTRFGGCALVGIRLTEGIFAETRYYLVNGSVNGVSASGIAFLIGTRF